MELSGPCKACGAVLTEEGGHAPYFVFAHSNGETRRELTIEKDTVTGWAKRGVNVVAELSVEFHMHHVRRAA